MNCKCGSRAVSHDGLCFECIVIRDELRREQKIKRRYDGRCKVKK